MDTIGAIVATGGSLVAIVLSILAFRGKSRVATADTYSKLLDTIGELTDQLNTALDRITMLEESVRTEQTMRLVLQTELDHERQQRQHLEVALLAEQREKDQLKRGYNAISQENEDLRARVARLEARLDTGDLTPPPHELEPE